MTEHEAVIFVFFFLAQYASIVILCILISILFLGRYLFTLVYSSVISLINLLDLDLISNIYILLINELDMLISLLYKIIVYMPDQLWYLDYHPISNTISYIFFQVPK